MNGVCHNCGASMAPTDFRACERCRAEWRNAKRKPGGPADQRQALMELVVAAKDVTRMLEAVRLTAGLGRGQITRLERAQSVIAKSEGVLRS